MIPVEAAMSAALEHESDLAPSDDLMHPYTPSNNPLHAGPTLKDAGMHLHA